MIEWICTRHYFTRGAVIFMTKSCFQHILPTDQIPLLQDLPASRFTEDAKISLGGLSIFIELSPDTWYVLNVDFHSYYAHGIE